MNQKNFDTGPLAKVEWHKSGTRSTLIFIKTLKHPPEKVWVALTAPEKLRQWAPFLPDRNLASIGSATLKMIDGMQTEEYASTVRTAVPPKLLEYTWGDDLLIWELTPEGTGTRLTLRHTVESTDWVPKVAAGWHLCLEVANRLLDGHPIKPIVGYDAMNYGWKELHDEYAETLGIDARDQESE